MKEEILFIRDRSLVVVKHLCTHQIVVYGTFDKFFFAF